MTVILTAPERISLMCEDVAGIKHGYWKTQKSIDPAERPCCLIRIDEGTFSGEPKAATDVEAEETYIIDYIGMQFDQGKEHRFEMEARQHAFDLYMYFFQRPSLQFTNSLAKPDLSPLIGLAFVKWARISRRSPIALMTGNGIETPFWGFTYAVGVFSGRTVKEILVPRIS